MSKVQFRKQTFRGKKMTIALAIKIGDGLVLAADSATTFSSPLQDSGKQETLNVFNNGEKITNLHRNLLLD